MTTTKLTPAQRALIRLDRMLRRGHSIPQLRRIKAVRRRIQATMPGYQIDAVMSITYSERTNKRYIIAL